MIVPESTPALSVILPTDVLETIAPVIEKLRRQTMVARLEVVIVTPAVEETQRALDPGLPFAAVRVVRAPALAPMGVPRLAGIRAATAPEIFVGETHSYLHPHALERMLAAKMDGSWNVVVPGFENGNPYGILSWSAFIAGYARWSARLPGGEIPEAPVYDAVYPRDFLLQMGDDLAAMLSGGDDLPRAVRERGLRVWFEPAARIDHVNMSKPWPWMHEQYLNGLMIGRRRARAWPWSRRLVYLAGGWLIPMVLFRRAWLGMRCIVAAEALPLLTFVTSFLQFSCKAAGELVGYAGGGTAEQERLVSHYEIRRLDYVPRNP